jgi:transketolase
MLRGQRMKIDEEIAPRVVFGRTLVELGRTHPRMLVLDPDVGPSTQTHLFGREFPERYLQVGIAEQNMVGMAAGLSTLGFTPWISAFAVFMTKRAGDQLRNTVAHPRANVKINGSYGGLPTGRAGATHAAVEDLAVMRCMPNLTIMVPADPRETEICTRLATDLEGPVYLRTVRCPVPVIFPEGHTVKVGSAVKLREGSDLAIISTGMMTPKALRAADLLAAEGIAIRLLHMPTLKPIDEESIRDAAESIGRILTIENHSIIGGLGGAVCEVTAESAPCRVRRLGFRDIFLESGDDEHLFSQYGMNTEQIAQAAREMVEKTPIRA